MSKYIFRQFTITLVSFPVTLNNSLRMSGTEVSMFPDPTIVSELSTKFIAILLKALQF